MGVVSNGTKRRSIGPIAGARDKGQSSWGEKRGGVWAGPRERGKGLGPREQYLFRFKLKF
jgi:hypothetical protein